MIRMCPICGYTMANKMCMSPSCKYVGYPSRNDRGFRSVVLLSSGMDSATALHWAHVHTDIASVLFFRYGQRGARFEYDNAEMLVNELGYPRDMLRTVGVGLQDVVRSSILRGSEAYEVRRRDVPDSFVPGRNLIFISIAGGVAYELGANIIIGGWNQVDVDYPDCSEEFLASAAEAVNESLGLGFNDIRTFSPILYHSKPEIIKMGEDLGVPWEYTRSCYNDHELACLGCDSCKKRVIAFLRAGVRDPAVNTDTWCKLSDRWDDLLAGDKTFTEEELWEVL